MSRTTMKGCVLTGVGLALVLSVGTGQAAYVVDGDGDGVADEVDQCLYTPRGVTVGKNGCSTPGDEDEDGVPESVDACPQTPAGARVDANGCALDGDVDGVADGLDRCPGTPVGSMVTTNGCQKNEKARVALSKPMRPAPPARPAAPATGLPSAAIPASPSVVMAPAPAPARSPAPSPAPTPSASAPVADAQAVRSPSKVSVVPVPPSAPVADGQHYLSIQFAPAQTELSGEWRQLLAGQVASLKAILDQRPGTTLIVVGNADAGSDGSQAEAVAARRAGVVRESLAHLSVPAMRLSVRTLGTRDPQFKGAEAARNRRVDLFLYDNPAVKVAVAPPAPVVAAPRPVVSAALPPAAPKPAPRVSAPANVTRPADVSIRFGAHSAELDAASTRALDAFADACVTPLRVDASNRIVVAGGAAAEESGRAAPELVSARATAIRTYLVSLGLPRDRVMIDSVASAIAGVKLRAL